MKSQEQELLSCEGIIGETRAVYNVVNNVVNINSSNGRMEFDLSTGLPKSLVWGNGMDVSGN